MKKIFLLILFLSVAKPFTAFAAKALLTNNCVKTNVGCEISVLTAYVFDENGAYVRSNELVRNVSNNNPMPFSALSENIIFENRYLISGMRIFDLQNKKFIHDGYKYTHIKYYEGNTAYYNGNFLGIINDKVLYANHHPAPQIYVFDLETHKYGKINDLRYYFMASGVYSPDGRKKAIADDNFFNSFLLSDKGSTSWNIKILDVRKNITKTIANDLILEPPSIFSGITTTLPISWLDNETILTQKALDEKVIINVNDGSIKPLRDPEWTPLGFGFEAKYSKSHKREIVPIRYNNEIIGEYRFKTPRTTDGFISIAFAKTSEENLGYPKGVAIWSSKSKTWIEFKTDWLINHIGWVDLP